MWSDIKEFFGYVCFIAICLLVPVGAFTGAIAMLETQQCKAYAQSKGATSNYSWMMCYITKDGKTLTYEEYVASEVGTKVKAEIE